VGAVKYKYCKPAWPQFFQSSCNMENTPKRSRQDFEKGTLFFIMLDFDPHNALLAYRARSQKTPLLPVFGHACLQYLTWLARTLAQAANAFTARPCSHAPVQASKRPLWMG
jgi:hypothetical protein